MKWKIGTRETSTEVNSWEFLEASGIIKNFESRGVIVTPTHDFELLKVARLRKYEIAKQKFIDERKLNRLITNDLEHNLFYVAWLQSEIIFIEKRQPIESTSNQIEIAKYRQFVETEIEKVQLKINTPQQVTTNTRELKVPEIALIHFYNCIQITRENANEIATQHGYTAKLSGEGLFQDYTHYSSQANRTGKPDPFSNKKLKNNTVKFAAFEKMIASLNEQIAVKDAELVSLNE